MPGSVRIGGSFKTIAIPSVKIAGAWKTVNAGFVKIGGAWKQWFSAAPAGAYELISTTVVSGTSTSSITFSSISQDYKHLQVRYLAKHSGTATGLQLQLNSASSGYARHQLLGNGSTVSSNNNTSQASITLGNGIARNGTVGAFAGGIIDVLDYSSTVKNTTVRALLGVAGADSGNQNQVSLSSGLWNNTSAVTSLRLFVAVGTVLADSRFSLYGIKG